MTYTYQLKILVGVSNTTALNDSFLVIMINHVKNDCDMI